VKSIVPGCCCCCWWPLLLPPPPPPPVWVPLLLLVWVLLLLLLVVAAVAAAAKASAPGLPDALSSSHCSCLSAAMHKQRVCMRLGEGAVVGHQPVPDSPGQHAHQQGMSSCVPCAGLALQARRLALTTPQRPPATLPPGAAPVHPCCWPA
jgi:hypothetical protein